MTLRNPEDETKATETCKRQVQLELRWHSATEAKLSNVAQRRSKRITAHIRSNNERVEQRSVNPGNIVSRVPMSLSTQKKGRRKEGAFYRMKKQIYLA